MSNPLGGSARLPRLSPSDLEEQQTQLYEAIVGGPRGRHPQPFRLVGADGALEGPFNAMLFSPAVGTELQRLGAAVRYRTSVSDRVREVAILLVASAWGSSFEAQAHMAVGRTVGLTENELIELAAGKAPDSLDATETLAAQAVIAMTTVHDLDDELYERTRVALGDRAMVELTTLVGYYATLALQLRVFRVDSQPSKRI